MAANRDGSWELIDGVQRLNTLIHFVGTEEQRHEFGLEDQLVLAGLEILTEFNGKAFEEVPQSLQLKFNLRPLKITTLSDKSDLKVRFDLFERLNTGGVRLTDQEIRACVFRGEFNDFISDMARNENFLSVVNLPESNESDGTREELVLKFYAYLFDRDSFVHSVVGFLNDYMYKASTHFDYPLGRRIFSETFAQLAEELPHGIRRGNRRNTPINLFEAVSVGAAQVILGGGDVRGKGIAAWMNDQALTRLTSGATNSRTRVRERINYCIERFT